MATKMEESFLQLQTSIHGSKNGGEAMWGSTCSREQGASGTPCTHVGSAPGLE